MLVSGNELTKTVEIGIISTARTIISMILFYLIGLPALLATPVRPGECLEVHFPMGDGSFKKCSQANPSKHASLLTNELKPEIQWIADPISSDPAPTEIPSVSYLVGKWNFTGYSNGHPTSGVIVFRDNGSYQIKGTISNLTPNKIMLFDKSGTYNIDEQKKTLLFTTNDDVHGSYRLENVKAGSFYMYNPNTSEYYNVGKGSVLPPKVPQTNIVTIETKSNTVVPKHFSGQGTCPSEHMIKEMVLANGFYHTEMKDECFELKTGELSAALVILRDRSNIR